MAKIETGFPVHNIRGRFGKVVFSTVNDETRMYPFKKRRNPRSDAQQTRRGLFADAVHSWQTLSDDEKHIWNHLARKNRKKLKKSCRGYHLYLRTVLYGETAPVVTGTAVFPAGNPLHVIKKRLRRSSVAAASALRFLFETPSKPLQEPFDGHPEQVKAA